MGGEKLLVGLRGAKNFSIAFRIVFRILFRVFQTVFRIDLKISGANSFCTRAALTIKQLCVRVSLSLYPQNDVFQALIFFHGFLSAESRHCGSLSEEEEACCVHSCHSTSQATA